MTENCLFLLDINCGNLPYFNSIIDDKKQLCFGRLKLLTIEKMILRLPFVNSQNKAHEYVFWKRIIKTIEPGSPSG